MRGSRDGCTRGDTNPTGDQEEGVTALTTVPTGPQVLSAIGQSSTGNTSVVTKLLGDVSCESTRHLLGIEVFPNGRDVEEPLVEHSSVSSPRGGIVEAKPLHILWPHRW